METSPSDLVRTPAGWQTLVDNLPDDFEALAKQHKVLEVQYGEAKITTAAELLRLVLVHVGADLPLRQTVALVAEAGGPDVSHVTLHKKMRLVTSYLGTLVARLSAMSAEALPERWAGYELLVVDGSSFCEPGADGTNARIHLQLRLADLSVSSAIVEDQSVGESFKRFVWRPGQLALGDRGYANPPGIVSVVEQGADVLVRVNRSALPVYALDGARVDLMSWLRARKGHTPREQRVTVRSREHGSEVHGRLIAFRLPAAQAEKARAWVRREHGSKASALDLEAAHYVVIFTTVPAERMSTAMCLELYRLRWQVELTFKRWKSLCHFDRLPNHRDDTIVSWLYAKLLLAIMMQRIATGPSLFPPEEPTNEQFSVAQDAVEERKHPMARDRCSSAAA